MASEYKINSLRRSIKSAERYLHMPLWKYFLILYALFGIMNGGLMLLIDYKSDIDITSSAYLIKLFAYTLVLTIGLMTIIRYFGLKALKRQKQELDEIEREMLILNS